MKLQHYFISIILLLVLFSCIQQSSTDSEADIKTNKILQDEWDKAFNASNVEGIMVLYLENAVRMPPNTPALVGKEAIRGWFKKGFESNNFKLENIEDEINILGDWAFTRGHTIGKIFPQNGEEPIEIRAKYISIRKKQSDGTWKVYCDIYNSDLPQE